jgi:hypothetical protein
VHKNDPDRYRFPLCSLHSLCRYFRCVLIVRSCPPSDDALMRRIIALLAGSRLVVVPVGDRHHGRDHTLDREQKRRRRKRTDENRQKKERKEVHRVSRVEESFFENHQPPHRTTMDDDVSKLRHIFRVTKFDRKTAESVNNQYSSPAHHHSFPPLPVRYQVPPEHPSIYPSERIHCRQRSLPCQHKSIFAAAVVFSHIL